MGTWALVYHSAIRRDIARIPLDDQRRIRQAIERLTDDPLPPAHRHLTNHPIADYRLRIGRCRVLYDVDTKTKDVFILKIVKRDDQTYR